MIHIAVDGVTAAGKTTSARERYATRSFAGET